MKQIAQSMIGFLKIYMSQDQEQEGKRKNDLLKLILDIDTCINAIEINKLDLDSDERFTDANILHSTIPMKIKHF